MKEIENQPRIKNFNLNLILTANSDVRILAEGYCITIVSLSLL